MTSSLVFNARYPHTPEQVWQALTHPKALATWLMENNFEPYVGRRFQFKEASLPGLETVIDCEVIALEPPRRLVYTWRTRAMPIPSLVTWMLMPIDGGGTQLQLRHSGLTKAGSALNAVSLIRPRPAQAQQPWHRPLAQLTVPAALPDQVHTERADPCTLLGLTFEVDWQHRLQEALPAALAQLMTASQESVRGI
ncbi:MAG: SRPBCC domain-containing protein [Cyanobacteria bacterium P01_A01_bin.114]